MRLLLFLFPLSVGAQFDYDRTEPFDTQREKLASRPTAHVWGASFAGPKGGRVNYVLVEPLPQGKPAQTRRAGVIFQHGGGQSMTNYLSEALILAELGVVSIIPDAPGRGPGKNNDVSSMSPAEMRDHFAEIVIVERRVLDLLLQQPDVDPKRIAYVGHSYGGVAGGVLAGMEPRISSFVLMGAVTSEAERIAENGGEVWQRMKQSMTPEEFARALEGVLAIDPGRFLPKATAPVFVQCAKFDTDDNVRGCPLIHQRAGGPKRLTWYDDDHNFTALEALRDRLYWLETTLKLRPVRPVLERWLRP